MPTSKEATIFIVISLLVIVLVFSSVADVLAKPRKPSITFEMKNVRVFIELSPIDNHPVSDVLYNLVSCMVVY